MPSTISPAVFGLRPISRTDHELKLEFNYLPDVRQRHFDNVPLTQALRNTREDFPLHGVTSIPGNPGFILSHGHIITMRTTDPVGYPLSPFELLDMHWRLNAVVALALSAASEKFNDEEFDDDEDVSPVRTQDRVARWLRSSSVLTEQQRASPVTSQFPSSPGKARQAAGTENVATMEEVS